MPDRIIVVLPDDSSDDDRRAAEAIADVVTTMAELESVVGTRPAGAQSAYGLENLPSFTPAESGVLTELAHRPDTRSRLATRLGITTSTLDNHVASIKRKVLDQLTTSGNAPLDGYLSMEALIGWTLRHMPQQKS